MKIKLLLLPVIMAVLITNLFAEKGFRLLATFQGKSPGDAFSERIIPLSIGIIMLAVFSKKIQGKV